MNATRKHALAAVLAMTMLAACIPAGSGPTNTQIGTASGAIIGGLIGANVDSDNPRTATAAAAAIGAVVGGAIGQQLDRQKAELDQGFTNDIDVINTGSELIVRMPNGILFDVDRADLRPQVRADLNVLAGNLLRYPNSTILITGHTDDTGSWQYNRDLSLRRAQSVASQLTAGGVSPARLQTFGAGYDQPIASNRTPEGRQQNRRVDITIRPNQ